MAEDHTLAEMVYNMRLLQNFAAESFKGHSPLIEEEYGLMVRTRYRMHYDSVFAKKAQYKFNMNLSISNEIFASRNPLSTLRPALIQELQLEQANKGRYVLLRTLERPSRMVGIQTVVEDAAGSVVVFSVYNYTTDPDDDNLDKILPCGTFFIIKEPYIKMSQEMNIRCDCPTDMVVLHAGHKLRKMITQSWWKNEPNFGPAPDPIMARPLPKTAEGWKERGNGLFSNLKNYSGAISCYLNALIEVPEGNGKLRSVLHSNLAACYLNTEYFELAVVHAKKALEGNTNPKALFRAGRAKYLLRKYPEAKKYFEKFLKESPGDEKGLGELQKCEGRLLETKGEFVMYRMHLENSLKPRQPMDCGDYVGPLKVIKMDGKGRGVVANQNIRVGTLLAVSKAFAFLWEKHESATVQINPDFTVDLGKKQELVAMISQAVTKNPHTFGPMIYDLSIGGHECEPVKLFCDPETKLEPIVDVQRLKHILSTNGFSMYTNNKKLDSDLDKCLAEDIYTNHFGSGLFKFPSYFNHSCVANTSWQFYNDVMVVRARRPIAAGEEVFLSYFNWDMQFPQRQERCKFFGFECRCRLCVEDGREGTRSRMSKEKAITKFNQVFKPKIQKESINGKVSHDLRKLIEDCRKTFNISGYDLRMLSMMHSWLGISYFKQGKYAEEIECHLDTISLYGFDPETLPDLLQKADDGPFRKGFLCQEVLDVIQSLIGAFCSSNQKQEMKKWIHILLALEKLYSGGDIKVVKLKYPRIKNLI